MDPLSATLLIKTLDGLTVRTTATAENIANAGTPNYRPVRVTFEQALAAAAGKGERAAAGVEPKVEQASVADSASGVRLDLELGTASATAMRYSAIAEVLNRQLQIDALAVAGN